MRYSRQELLLGASKQKKLNMSSVVVIGVGAIGGVVAELLVRAGVNVSLIDRDIVELNNLQRQTLFGEKDVGKSKIAAAVARLKEINSSCQIQGKAVHLNSKNIIDLKGDLIIDCTDNIKTRLLINDYCKKMGKVWIYGAAIKTKGYVMPIFPEGPCLGCFIEEGSFDTCDTVGVLNTITGVIAARQVTAAIKILLGEEVERNLQYVDLWNNEVKDLRVKRRNECRACQGKYDYLNEVEESKRIKFCATRRFQISGVSDFESVVEKWKKVGEVTEDGEMAGFENIVLFRDGRALVKAQTEELAMSAYSKWVGN
jgi:molybdopterin-synthase adenylyltransferase